MSRVVTCAVLEAVSDFTDQAELLLVCLAHQVASTSAQRPR